MSVCPQVSARLPLDTFPSNSILGPLIKKICPEIPNLVEIRQIYRAFYAQTSVSFTVAGEINSPQKNFCASPNTSMLLAVKRCSIITESIAAFP